MDDLAKRIVRRMKEIREAKGVGIEELNFMFRNGFCGKYLVFEEDGLFLINTFHVTRFCEFLDITIDEFFCKDFGLEVED